MKWKMFRCVCIICIFSILNVFSSCTSKPDMVTDQDIIELYNDNKELFDRTAKEVEKLEKKLQEINGLSFRYEEHIVVAYSINTEISFDFPDNLYSDLLDCFTKMESIINEEYDDDEYVLVIGHTTKSSASEDIKVTEFLFGNEVIEVVSALTYSEDKPSDSARIINENWCVTGWGRV